MRETLVKSEEFKDSPLGKIPTGWDVVSIDEIAIYVGSGITPRGGSNVYQKEGILFIRSQNVTFNGLRLDDVAYIDNRTHESMKRSEVFAHDVLLNITGASIGRCCPVPPGLEAANVNQHVCAIRLPNPNREDAIFLSSVLASYIGQSQIDRLNAGGNREGLNYEQLRAFVIPFPPPNERASIAKILETVDETIAHTSSLIAKLKQMKAGLLHDLLTRGLDENGELRDAIGQPEQFKDSPLGRIPKDWKILPLTSLTQYITYGFTNPMPTTKDGPWMVTAFDIADGKICYEQARHTSEKAYKNDLTHKSKPDLGDILITKDGTLGRIAVVDRIDICINQSVACLRPLPDTDVKFLVHYLRSEQGQERMLADAEGSTIKHIYITKLAQMEVPIPPREEARKISDILDSHNTRIRTEEAYRDKLKLQKQGLMHDLLTGKVRVKDADKFTPASDTV